VWANCKEACFVDGRCESLRSSSARLGASNDTYPASLTNKARRGATRPPVESIPNGGPESYNECLDDDFCLTFSWERLRLQQMDMHVERIVMEETKENLQLEGLSAFCSSNISALMTPL